MADKYSTIQQHQPLRTPAGWGKQEKALIVQLDEIFDDIYRRFGRLRLTDLEKDFRTELEDGLGNYSQLVIEVDQISTEVGNKISKTSTLQTADQIVTEAVSESATAASGTYIAKTTTLQTADQIVSTATTQAASSAASTYIAKTTTLQTATQIVNEAVSQSASSAASNYIAKTTTYQTADSIVSSAVTQAGTAAASAYIAKTSVYQDAASIVSTAEGYTDTKLTDYSTTTQTSSMISSYVTSNAYGLVSGITITSSGVDVSGSKHINLDVNSGNYVHISSAGIEMKGSRVSVNGKDMWARDDIIILKKTDNEATVINSMSGEHDWVLIKPYYDASIAFNSSETFITESSQKTLLNENIGGLSFGDGASWYQYDLSIHIPTATGGGSSSVSFTITLSEKSDFSDSYSFSTSNMNVTSFPTTISASSGHIVKNLCKDGKPLYCRVTDSAGATFTIDHIDMTATCDAVTGRVPCTVYYFP